MITPLTFHASSLGKAFKIGHQIWQATIEDYANAGDRKEYQNVKNDFILNLKYFAPHAGSSDIFIEKEADFSLKTCKKSIKLVKLLTRVFFIQETFI
jgi:hypothetical protein